METNLRKADFTSANFANARKAQTFIDSNLQNTKFNNSILINGLNSVIFSGCDMNGSIFWGAKFLDIGDNSQNAAVIFDSTNLTNCDFSETVLSNNIASVKFNNVTIKGSTFEFARLSQASRRFGSATASAVNFSNLDLTNVNFSKAHLSDSGTGSYASASVNFTNCILKGANFSGAVLASANGNFQASSSAVNFSGMDLANIDFSNAKFSVSATGDCGTIYSSVNMFNANLNGSKFDNTILGIDKSTGVNFANTNLQNTSFINAIFSNATNMFYSDLRGADLTGTVGTAKTQNTIWNDGVIKSFSMESVDDNLSIRKYTPATEGGTTISAKFAEDASVSGGAMLTLEQGSEVEVVDNTTLSFGADSSLLINTDKDGSTTFSVESGAGLTFVNGATLTVNIIDADSALNADGYKFAVMNWNDDSRMTGLDDFVIDSSLFLTLNGTSYDKA